MKIHDSLTKAILVILLLLLLSVSCVPSETDSVRASVTDTGDEDSYAILNERIRQEPNNPELYVKRAELLRLKNDLKGAYADLDRALKIDSILPMAHSEMGMLYYFDGQLGEAKFAFERAISLDPEYLPAKLQLAEIYLVLRNYDRSMTEVNDVLKLDDQLAKAYFLKGLIYKEQKNTELAKSSFQTATEMDPQHTEAFNLLGMLYAEEDDALAMSYYNTVLDIDSAHREALYNRAYFLQDQHYAQDAIEAYDLMLKFYPGNPAAYFNKGYIYFGFLDMPEKAVDAFTEAIRSNPDYAMAYFNRGVALEELGRNSDAIKDYEKVLDLEPNNVKGIAAMSRLKGN